MKRIFIIGYAALFLAPFACAQEDTPAPPQVEPQVPGQEPGTSRSNPPAQAVVPVPVPIAPPKPNGPVQSIAFGEALHFSMPMLVQASANIVRDPNVQRRAMVVGKNVHPIVVVAHAIE